MSAELRRSPSVPSVAALSAAADIGQVVAAGAAVAALGYNGFQIHLTRVRARQTRVYDYSDRLTHQDFYPYIAESRSFWIAAGDAEQRGRWAEWEKLPMERKHKIVLPMNIYEEVATMYNDGLLDRRVVRRLLGPSALLFWEEAGWFIERYRRDEPLAMVEWERMNVDLRVPRGRFDIGRPWPHNGGLFGSGAS